MLNARKPYFPVASNPTSSQLYYNKFPFPYPIIYIHIPPLQAYIRANLPALIPNPLIPLADPDPHQRIRTQLERPTQRLANSVVSDTANAPVDGQARCLGKPWRNGKGQLVQDLAARVAVVEGGGVERGDEERGGGKGRGEGEDGGRRDEVHGCVADEVGACVWGGFVVITVTVAIAVAVAVGWVGRGEVRGG